MRPSDSKEPNASLNSPDNTAVVRCGIRTFSVLQLPAEHFDGVFANAALFHVPSQELPRVLKELWATLRPSGVLFSSNPRGDNEEGWNGERYGVYYNLERWRELVTGAGFVEITHYYRPPGSPPRAATVVGVPLAEMTVTAV